MGLIEKIKLAKSRQVIEKLLEEGNRFDMVSPKTKRRWSYVALRRLKQIDVEKELKVTAEKKVENKKPKKQKA